MDNDRDEGRVAPAKRMGWLPSRTDGHPGMVRSRPAGNSMKPGRTGRREVTEQTRHGKHTDAPDGAVPRPQDEAGHQEKPGSAWTRGLFLAMLPVVLLGIPTLAYPPGVDQATFAMVGDGWFQGFLPYLDRWDVKPRAIFLIYGLARAVMGHTWLSIRLLDLAWTLGTCAALYGLSVRCLGRRTGVAAALLYGVHVVIQPPWEMGQTDGMTGLLVVGAAILFADALGTQATQAGANGTPGRWHQGWPRDASRALLAGLLLGAAVLLKLPAALFLLVLLGILSLHVDFRGQVERRHVVLLLALGVGSVVPIAVTTAYFFLAGGGRMFVETLLVWAPRLAWSGRPPLGALVSDGIVLAHRNLWSVPLLAAAGGGAVLLEATRGRLRRLAVPLLLLGAGVLMTVVQFKFYRYHWMACLPGLALLGGHGLALSWEAVRGVSNAGLRRTATACLVVVSVLGLPLDVARPFASTVWLAARLDGRMDDVTYYQQFFRASSAESYNFAEDVVAGRYIGQRVEPQDTLFVWGFEPPIYLESGCRPASRFIYHYPIAARWSPESWRATLLSDLEASRPAYFVVSRKGSAAWMTGRRGNTADLLRVVPRVEAFLEANYRLETTIGAFDIYRRSR